MIQLNASDVICSIESSIANSGFEFQTIHVQSNLVAMIRSGIRRIYTGLYEAEENYAGLEELRMTLLKLQTSPELPELKLLDQIGLGDIDAVRRRWGSDLSETCRSLLHAIELLNTKKSPLMIEFVKSITESVNEYGVDGVRIWAHKNERESLIAAFKKENIILGKNSFISSLPEYRKSIFFDILYRLGPLRSLGWSRIPKVVVSAPRYRKLIQVMWAGSFNESDFGVDPVVRGCNYFDNFAREEKTSLYDVNIEPVGGRGFIDVDVDVDVDDLNFLSERIFKGPEKNPCFLIELHENTGVLVTPKSQQLIFNRDDEDLLFAYKSVSEIEADDFLLLYDIEADLGGSHASVEIGSLAPLWKGALRNMYQAQYSNLIQRMESSGIDLLDLDRAAKEWMSAAEGEVIHGPQFQRHFKALIQEVLPGCIGKASWINAWKEIRDSRTEAIQYGRIESAIVNEVLLDRLAVEADRLMSLLSGEQFFCMRLDADSGLSGIVKFYPVIDVTAGFLASHEVIGEVDAVSSFNKYRVNF